jgi:hypothetical protein
VNKQEALQWEAKWARPAALAAFFAAVLLIAQIVLLQTVIEDRARVEPLADFLLSIDENPEMLLGSRIAQAVAALLIAGIFYYLFRALQTREAGVPSWFVYLIFLGPALYAIALVLGAISQIDAASEFAGAALVGGEPGEDRAEQVLEDNASAVIFAFNFAGQVAVAFLFVMLPLRARRVGLLSPFMSILGVVTGALIVLQIVPVVPVIIQAFWLGALGSIFLDNWPGGRGPAWETGEAEPWPTPARRGAEPGQNGDGSLLDPADRPEPEPVPERPSSRKRRRNR